VTDPIILVLTSFAAGEMHGYAIMEDVERFSGVKLGPGTLYGAITRMEERGLISPVASADRRQPYRITPLGLARLQEAVAAMDRVVAAAGERVKHA
jgi:hypothetical protein